MLLLSLAAALLAACREGPSPPPLPKAGEVFRTLPPGSELPDPHRCVALVRRSSWEPQPANQGPNQRTGPARVQIDGASAAFNARYAARVDGNFTGTTDEIIQWGACKWGFDEDSVRAIAMQESSWKQAATGDQGESFGLLQVKHTVHEDTFPASRDSTAFNVDYALAWRRACYEGDFTWLNEPPMRGGYAAGDEWGCIGAWFSGNWHDSGAEQYIKKVKRHLRPSS